MQIIAANEQLDPSVVGREKLSVTLSAVRLQRYNKPTDEDWSAIFRRLQRVNMINTKSFSPSLWLMTLILLVSVEQADSAPANKTIRMGYLLSFWSLGGAINVAIENAQNDGLLRDYNFRYIIMHAWFTATEQYSFMPNRHNTLDTNRQGCPQDVKSQDRDETETFHFFKLSRPRRDRDVEPSGPRRDRDVPFSKLPRPRRDVQRSRPRRDRDVPKHLETAVSQFKNTN